MEPDLTHHAPADPPTDWVDQVAELRRLELTLDPLEVVRMTGFVVADGEATTPEYATYCAAVLDLLGDDLRLSQVLQRLTGAVTNFAVIDQPTFDEQQLRFVATLYRHLILLGQSRSDTVAMLRDTKQKSHEDRAALLQILHAERVTILRATARLKAQQYTLLFRRNEATLPETLKDPGRNLNNTLFHRLHTAAHEAICKGFVLTEVQEILQNAANCEAQEPIASVFFHRKDAVLRKATEALLAKCAGKKTIARYMEFERPVHLPGLIRDAFLRGIPLSKLRERARAWHPRTEDALIACIETLGPVYKVHGLLCKLFVEGITYDRPGIRPLVHPGVVTLAKKMLRRTDDGYYVCPHPVCRRYHAVPREGLDEWRSGFSEHYHLSIPTEPDQLGRDFEQCWAAFWLSHVAGNERSVCPEYEPFRPFLPATRKDLEDLTQKLCRDGSLMQLCGADVLAVLQCNVLAQSRGVPPISRSNNASATSGGAPNEEDGRAVLADACRRLHCLWLRTR